MRKMPESQHELADMIAERDGISWNEAMAAVLGTSDALADAFMNGNLNEVEDILREELGLEPDYLDLFIF